MEYCTYLVGGMGEVHLLDLLVAFDTNDRGILLDQLRGLGMGEQGQVGSPPSMPVSGDWEKQVQPLASTI